LRPDVCAGGLVDFRTERPHLRSKSSPAPAARAGCPATTATTANRAGGDYRRRENRSFNMTHHPPKCLNAALSPIFR
jgi:hypothetical protein